MLTKQQIADAVKALDTQVHADATRAFTSAQRHTMVKQSEERRDWMTACEATGGHVFAVSGRCKFCKASNDRPNVANLGVATGVAAGLSSPASVELTISSVRDDTTWDTAAWTVVDAFRAVDAEPAPEVISKAPDALPAAPSDLSGTEYHIGCVKVTNNEEGMVLYRRMEVDRKARGITRWEWPDGTVNFVNYDGLR